MTSTEEIDRLVTEQGKKLREIGFEVEFLGTNPEGWALWQVWTELPEFSEEEE